LSFDPSTVQRPAHSSSMHSLVATLCVAQKPKSGKNFRSTCRQFLCSLTARAQPAAGLKDRYPQCIREPPRGDALVRHARRRKAPKMARPHRLVFGRSIICTDSPRCGLVFVPSLVTRPKVVFSLSMAVSSRTRPHEPPCSLLACTGSSWRQPIKRRRPTS
jgi:hypothetical protein